jgi:hypothetical protein
MVGGMPYAAIVVTALMCLVAGRPAGAQTWTPPSESARCPSAWGAADERGAANLQGRETVLRAARLIRTGDVIELGHVLSAAISMARDRSTSTPSGRS